MIAGLDERREVRTSRGRQASEKAKSPARFVALLLLALLAAALVFSHGCHGDEDHELFSRGWWVSF